MRRSAVILFILLLAEAVWASLPLSAWPQDEGIKRVEGEVQELKKENEELKKRLDNIEAEQEEVKHSYGTLSKLVDVSGYADAEYSFTNQRGENSKFRIRHLSLFFTKDIQKEWKLFTEVEFEDAPRIQSDPKTDTVTKSQGTLFVEQMYIQYHPTFEWDLRFGRFLTPAGIWAIYHYPPYVPTQTAPLFHKIIFPQVSDGIQYRRSVNVFNSLLDTTLYAANGAGNPGSGDLNENKAAGARLNYATYVLGDLSFGGSYYREKDNQDAMRNSFGAHLLFTRGSFKLQAEYAFRHNRPPSGISFNDAGSYTQLSYDIDKWTLAGRFDWYDRDQSDPKNDHYRYTGAVNYHFAPNVVAKAEYNKHVFDDPATKNFQEFIMAIVVAIGDL